MKKALRIFTLLVFSSMIAISGCKKDDDSPSGGGNNGGGGGGNTIENGALPGVFSVSDTMQVRFSQGNLQYQASTNTWRFAEHQYDFVGGTDSYSGGTYGNVNGSSNDSISSSYNGWIDMFGWGTSGWNNGNTYYRPYDIGNNDNKEEGYGYGPTDGTNYEYNLTGAYVNSDWGVYNAISNGGNRAEQWRTLTNDEWYYLWYTRANAANKRGWACVNNINGIVILPDNWTQPSGVSFTPDISGFTTNTYTTSQWTLMENNGAVFLTAAGGRIGASIQSVGWYGLYWSSSYTGSDGACFLIFNSDEILSWDCYFYVHAYRYYGCSVRLVQDY